MKNIKIYEVALTRLYRKADEVATDNYAFRLTRAVQCCLKRYNEQDPEAKTTSSSIPSTLVEISYNSFFRNKRTMDLR